MRIWGLLIESIIGHLNIAEIPDTRFHEQNVCEHLRVYPVELFHYFCLILSLACHWKFNIIVGAMYIGRYKM
jgi:hypothetical protein